jgi:hypothetical protein
MKIWFYLDLVDDLLLCCYTSQFNKNEKKNSCVQVTLAKHSELDNGNEND